MDSNNTIKVNDYIISRSEGICQVEEITQLDFVQNKDQLYYVLVPISDKSARIFIPTNKSKQRCRCLISVDNAKKLLDDAKNISFEIISNDKERETAFRTSIEECKPRELVSVLKYTRHRMDERIKIGKKVTASDEKYFQLAERNLCHELGFVLNLSEDEVRNILEEKLAMA